VDRKSTLVRAVKVLMCLSYWPFRPFDGIKAQPLEWPENSFDQAL